MKLDEGWVKINCDGAFDNNVCGDFGVAENGVTRAGIGVLGRDDLRCVVAGKTCQVRVNSILEAEAIAVKEGVLLTIEKDYRQIILESDSIAMVKALTGKGACDWHIGPYIQEVLVTKGIFEGFKVEWISRKANCVVDWVAKEAKKGMCITNWVNQPLSSFVNILSKYGLPAPPNV
ncbi:hypothetical protein PTKIN_Ptkin15bG0128100 [Pterospermum kingtungense]